MSLKLVGPENVRQLIASAQLSKTLIPESTRAFFGYLLEGEIRIAVGTHIAMRPPHKAVRAAFPHTASTSGI